MYTSLCLWCSAFPRKRGPTLTAVPAWSALGQGSLHSVMDVLHVSESSPSVLEGWSIGGSAGGRLYQQNLEAVMVLGLLQWPQPPGESGTSAVIHAALGRGPDCSEKLHFFQIQPLARVVRALQQPAELAVTVGIREPVNEELDEGALR